MRQVDSAGAGFLYGETPGWHMHVSALLVLDTTDTPGFDFDAVRELYARRLAGVPELRARLVNVPMGLDRPALADDPTFDIDAHCHEAHLPAPGTRRQLADLVSRLVARKLDRRSPLWEAWFIDGLDDGRVALLVKMHHALVDGTSGMHLASIVMDTSPTPTAAPTGERPGLAAPSTVRLGAGTARTLAALPWRSVRFANQFARQTVTFVRQSQRPDAPPLAFSAPRTELNRNISASRSLAMCTLSLDDIRTVKSAFGTSVNDVVLAMAGGALRAYLVERGGLPETSLVAQVPVSVRREDSLEEMGTQVVNMFTTLATDIDTSVDRLREVASVTSRAKDYQRAIFADRAVALPDLVPPFVISVVARAFTGLGLEGRMPPLYNAIVSDVRGSPVELYVGGARLVAMYPFGPLLLGSALNVTALSHLDEMNIGIAATPEAVPDPWELVEHLEAELARLLDAARPAG
ncbi:MAG: diacylglycerol O-acyltransferase [Acidimicrobiia bacterium]